MAVSKFVPALFLLAALVLAGCSGGGGGKDKGTDTSAPPIEATSTTGGIRGVVVDQRIVPIKAATVHIEPGNKTVESATDGGFAVSGLDAGDYVVTANHPLYDEVKVTTTVVAGDSNPPALRLQLTRVILAEPYKTTEKFEGYIFCSAGHTLVGYSEECGEGVGVPGVGRVGGQDNNNVQYDFTVDSTQIKTIQVELNWEATAQTAASGELLTYVSTEWLCDPLCSGNTFVRGGSGSPLLLRADYHGTVLTNTTPCNCDKVENITTDMVFSVFTWANPDTVDPVTGMIPLPTVILQQPYDVFVTKSYVLPLPAGWSFVNEDPDPFA